MHFMLVSDLRPLLTACQLACSTWPQNGAGLALNLQRQLAIQLAILPCQFVDIDAGTAITHNLL